MCCRDSIDYRETREIYKTKSQTAQNHRGFWEPMAILHTMFDSSDPIPDAIHGRTISMMNHLGLFEGKNSTGRPLWLIFWWSKDQKMKSPQNTCRKLHIICTIYTIYTLFRMIWLLKNDKKTHRTSSKNCKTRSSAFDVKGLCHGSGIMFM